MHNAFDPEEIYEKLEEILSFESALTNKRKWNDPAFWAYEECLKSFPRIISFEELKKYHEFLKDVWEKSEEKVQAYEENEKKIEEFEKEFEEENEELEEENDKLTKKVGSLEEQLSNLSDSPEKFVRYMLDEIQRVTSPQSYVIVEKAIRTALTIYKLQELSEE